MSIHPNLWVISYYLPSKQHSHLEKCLVELCPALTRILCDYIVISTYRVYDKCPAECQGSSCIANALIPDAIVVLCQGLLACNLAVPGL